MSEKTVEDFQPDPQIEEVPKPAELMMQRMWTELRGWSEAFQPLFESCRASSRFYDFFPAAFLKLQSMAIQLTLESVHGLEGTAKEQTIKLVSREMLELGKEVIDRPGFIKGYTLDNGLLPHLSAIVFACPDGGIRREAVEMIRSTIPRKEGIWDSVKLVEACERVL